MSRAGIEIRFAKDGLSSELKEAFRRLDHGVAISTEGEEDVVRLSDGFQGQLRPASQDSDGNATYILRYTDFSYSWTLNKKKQIVVSSPDEMDKLPTMTAGDKAKTCCDALSGCASSISDCFRYMFTCCMGSGPRDAGYVQMVDDRGHLHARRSPPVDEVSTPVA